MCVVCALCVFHVCLVFRFVICIVSPIYLYVFLVLLVLCVFCLCFFFSYYYCVCVFRRVCSSCVVLCCVPCICVSFCLLLMYVF